MIAYWHVGEAFNTYYLCIQLAYYDLRMAMK